MSMEILKGDPRKTPRLGFSIAQLSAVTSLSKGYIRKEIREGRLAARRFGRRIVILNDEHLRRYLEDR